LASVLGIVQTANFLPSTTTNRGKLP
jgi:hypothetical protein